MTHLRATSTDILKGWERQMAESGIKHWCNNTSDEFHCRTARVLAQMVSTNRILFDDFLREYLADVAAYREAQKHALEKSKLPKRAGW